MDKDQNGRLTSKEFVDSNKQDPAMAKVPSPFRGVFSFPSSDTATSDSIILLFCVIHSGGASRSVRRQHLALEGLTRQEIDPCWRSCRGSRDIHMVSGI